MRRELEILYFFIIPVHWRFVGVIELEETLRVVESSGKTTGDSWSLNHNGSPLPAVTQHGRITGY